MLTQNLPDFWDNLYAEGKDYWNLKKVTPALTEFFKHPSCPACAVTTCWQSTLPPLPSMNLTT